MLNIYEKQFKSTKVSCYKPEVGPSVVASVGPVWSGFSPVGLVNVVVVVVSWVVVVTPVASSDVVGGNVEG